MNLLDDINQIVTRNMAYRLQAILNSEVEMNNFFHKKTDRSVKTLRYPLTVYIVVRVILLQIIYNLLLSHCRKSIHIGQQGNFHDQEERCLVRFSRKNQNCLLLRDNSGLVKAVLVKKMLCVFF